MKHAKFKWAGKKALVTGAGGFIGSHLVEYLAAQGAHVRAMVRYNSRGTYGWLQNQPITKKSNIHMLQGDLRDSETVLRAFEDVEYVFHLGAMISIPYSYVNPWEVEAVNVTGTLNVLNACRRNGIKKLVHTSTSEVYGTALYVPIDEKHPLQAQSPYSATKIAADKLVESHVCSFSVPAVTVRPFNTYGPRQSARAVIPTIIVQLLRGSHISIGSLSPTRDFTYVDDTVRGFVLAAQSSDETNGKVINLGTGEEISINDLAHLLSRLVGGKDLSIKKDSGRIRPKNSEVHRLCSNNKLARKLLGWKPSYSLREGLQSTINWLKVNSDDYKRAQAEYVI